MHSQRQLNTSHYLPLSFFYLSFLFTLKFLNAMYLQNLYVCCLFHSHLTFSLSLPSLSYLTLYLFSFLPHTLSLLFLTSHFSLLSLSYLSYLSLYLFSFLPYTLSLIFFTSHSIPYLSLFSFLPHSLSLLSLFNYYLLGCRYLSSYSFTLYQNNDIYLSFSFQPSVYFFCLVLIIYPFYLLRPAFVHSYKSV